MLQRVRRRLSAVSNSSKHHSVDRRAGRGPRGGGGDRSATAAFVLVYLWLDLALFLPISLRLLVCLCVCLCHTCKRAETSKTERYKGTLHIIFKYDNTSPILPPFLLQSQLSFFLSLSSIQSHSWQEPSSAN